MSRFEDVSRAFLRYLYDASGFRPPVARFFDSPHAVVDQQSVTQEELAPVISRLRNHGLLTGENPAGVAGRVGLTGAGLICAGEHDGDIGKWAGSTPGVRLAPPEEADSGRPDGAGTGGEQGGDGSGTRGHRKAPEFAGLVRVARVLLLALPAFSTPEREQERIERSVTRLLEATQQAEPDTQRIRKLAVQLRQWLTIGPLASTLGAVLLDGLDEAIKEHQLV